MQKISVHYINDQVNELAGVAKINDIGCLIIPGYQDRTSYDVIYMRMNRDLISYLFDVIKDRLRMDLNEII